jgi:hypothetical protein
VQPEQQIIADWIKRTLQRNNWTAADWAKATGTGMAPTTITRAVDPDYASVTGTKTLHALARAAGVPSVLDFLETDQATTPAAPQPPAVPSAESLSTLLAAVLPLAPRGRQTAESLRVVAAALESGLALLAEQIANGEDLALGVASRAAVTRFRALTQQ